MTREPVLINAVSARAGGGQTYIAKILPDLQTELESRGHRVVVVLPREMVEGVTRSTAGVSVRSGHWTGWPPPLRLMAEQVVLPWLAWRLRAVAIVGVGDTVPLLSPVPTIIFCRNLLLYMDVQQPSVSLRLKRLLSRAGGRRATGVVAVSHAMAAAVVAVTGRTDVAVAHHGPGLVLRARHNDPPSVLSGIRTIVVLGSVYRHKRIGLAVEAVAELARRGNDIRLIAMGAVLDATEFQRITRLVSDLGLSAKVEFRPAGDAAAVQKLLDNADVLVVTSSAESFCHPILEAFQVGVPVVVAADLPVAEEITAGAAEPASPCPVGVADAVAAVLDDAVYRRNLIERGFARSLDFDWKTSARLMTDVVVRTASEGRTRASRHCRRYSS